MTFVSWSEELSVGNEMIDADHKQLIDMFNRLHDAMAVGKGSDVIVDVLAELFDHVGSHFEREDKLMNQRPHPGFITHKTEHKKLLDETRALQKAFVDGSLLMSVPTLRLLRDRLLDHFLNFDKALAVAIRNG